LLLPILEPHIKKKEKTQKKNARRKPQKYISKKNIPEHPGNYWKLVDKDQNI